MGIKIRGIVGALLTYTVYTGYTYSQCQKVIKEREADLSLSVDEKWNILKINDRFENPFHEYRPQTIYEFFVMRFIELFDVLKLKEHNKGGVPYDLEDVKKSLNWVKFKDEGVLNGYLKYTWFGQSCGLLESGDRRMIMDPLFENYIVHKKFGPKRIVPLPVEKDINNIDWVFISHDHPDHLGEDSVIQLSKSVKKWIVPTGLGSFLKDLKIENDRIIEMTWWERLRLDDEFEVVCLPAMHWSGRKLYDSNLTLWCTFLILKNGKGLFYHGGDTGYVDGLFKDIGDKYGPVKLGALPIGQYCPEWHQKPRHISPKESIKIKEDMMIEKIVGVHWGTFVLSSENYLEPKKLLEKEAIMVNNVNNILAGVPGKSIIIKEDDPNDEVEFDDDFRTIYK